MIGRQKLVPLWALLLLTVALCPGVQYAHAKRGFRFPGGKKGDASAKESAPSQRGGFTKHGLKWAGAAAAAGMLGGTGTGYGLGFLGRPKHSSKGHHGHRGEAAAASQREQHFYYREGQGSHNRSQWRAVVSAATPAPVSGLLLVLAPIASLVITLWMRVV